MPGKPAQRWLFEGNGNQEQSSLVGAGMQSPLIVRRVISPSRPTGGARAHILGKY